jgi:hypothetical protein
MNILSALLKKATFVLGLSLATQTAFAQQPNALNFDGANDFLNVPNASGLISNSTATRISMSCWVFPKVSNPTAHNGFLGIRNESNAGFYLLQLQGLNSVECRFRNSIGAATTITSAGLVPNTWQHYVMTYDGTKLRVYRNGLLHDSTAASGNITITTEALTIGRTLFNGSPFSLNGSLDEVGLWNRALTASEVQCIYHAPIDTSSPGLKLYYDMNLGVRNGNNAGTTSIPNLAGNINATVSGFALSGTTSNFVAGAPNTGYIYQQICGGQSYSFNGQTFTQPGFYTEHITGGQGCDSVAVLELVQPTFVSPTITLNGGVLHCDENNATYQWIDCSNNTPLPGATLQDLNPLSSGTYSVVITLNGCDSTAACVNYLFNGIEHTSAVSNITLFPNPAQSNFTISRNITEKLTVSIIAVDGQEVMNFISNDVNTKVDVLALTAGTYFVKMTSNEGVSQKKITVTH